MMENVTGDLNQLFQKLFDEQQVSTLFAHVLDTIPEGLFLNFQKPVLKNCNEIDDYYASMEA